MECTEFSLNVYDKFREVRHRHGQRPGRRQVTLPDGAGDYIVVVEQEFTENIRTARTRTP